MTTKHQIFALLLLALTLGRPDTAVAEETWSNQRPANLVLGTDDFETFPTIEATDSSTPSPNDVAVDPTTGKVFVADSLHRILRFSSAAAAQSGASAESVLGQENFTASVSAATQSNLDFPSGIFIDHTGTLWVSDTFNSRVLRFDNASTKATGANADGVLGQSNFTTKEINRGGSVGPGTLSQPQDLLVDLSGTLWVADNSNSRVLRYSDAANLADGADADGVLGQPDLSTNASGLAANRLKFPSGLAISAEGSLYVVDQGNSRVLRFDNAAAKAGVADANADNILGQPNPTTGNTGTDDHSFNSPANAAIDSCGDLWVADADNSRILLFRQPMTKPTGGSADHVLGQPDFDSNTPPTVSELTALRLAIPRGLAFDLNGRLWVADSANNRVLRFSPGDFQPDNSIGKKANSKKGGDIYNASAAGQKVTDKSKKLKKLTFHGSVQNDGPNADTLTLSGTRKNAYFRVKYFDVSGGKLNITGSVTTGSKVWTDLAAEETRLLKIEVKPKRKAKDKKKKRTFTLTALSSATGSKDVAKAKAKTKK